MSEKRNPVRKSTQPVPDFCMLGWGGLWPSDGRSRVAETAEALSTPLIWINKQPYTSASHIKTFPKNSVQNAVSWTYLKKNKVPHFRRKYDSYLFKSENSNWGHTLLKSYNILKSSPWDTDSVHTAEITTCFGDHQRKPRDDSSVYGGRILVGTKRQGCKADISSPPNTAVQNAKIHFNITYTGASPRRSEVTVNFKRSA